MQTASFKHGHKGICAVLLNKSTKSTWNSSHSYFNKYKFIKDSLSPYVSRSFALKISSQCFSSVLWFQSCRRVTIQNIILKSAPLKAKPFIVLLPEHNFNRFESTRAYFRGEVKHITDNGFSRSLNWTMVWVSFLIGLDFQSIKGKLPVTFYSRSLGKNLLHLHNDCGFLSFAYVTGRHYPMLGSRTIPGSAPFSQPHQSTYTTEPWGEHSGALAEVHFIHFITSNISLGSCKQQGGFCIKKSAALPRPQCDVNLPEISGLQCRERSDLSTLIGLAEE